MLFRRLIVAILAMLGQIGAGIALPAAPARAAEIMGVPIVVCHEGVATGERSTGDAPSAPHHAHDCALCPGCLGSVLPPLALSDQPPMPRPTWHPATSQTPKPEATGPPIYVAGLPPPRGPPSRA